MEDNENILNLPTSFNGASIGGLLISSFIHKTRIVVNEEGCSVAAVSINPFDFSHGGMENASLNIFDETRRTIEGEMAAQEFRNGTARAITGMKPLRYKRGFLSSSMRF